MPLAHSTSLSFYNPRFAIGAGSKNTFRGGHTGRLQRLAMAGAAGHIVHDSPQAVLVFVYLQNIDVA